MLRRVSYATLPSLAAPAVKAREEEESGDIQKIANFVAHLKQAAIEDQVLELPEGVYFWGHAKYGRKLFIRSCYDRYFRLHFEAVAQKSKDICVYTGSPGIGKSMFAIYVLWRLLATDTAIAASSVRTLGATVALASANSDVECATDAKIKEWRDKQDVFACFIKSVSQGWYIRCNGEVSQGANTTSQDIVFWDVQEPSPIPTTLVRGFSFASPAKLRIHEPGKQRNVQMLIMPPWSLDELQLLRRACYPQTTVEEVQTLYQMIGGKPRYIFEKAVTDADIDDGMNLLKDYPKALRIIHKGIVAEQAAHSLLTVATPTEADPAKCNLSWASDRIADKIYRKFVDSVRQDLQNFVLLGGDIAPVAVARGLVFERLVYDCLPLGDVTDLEALSHTSPSVLPALPTVTSAMFKSLEEFVVPPTDGVCYCPQFSNLCAVDCFLKCNDVLYAFQITVSQKHKIKAHGLRKIWDLCRGTVTALRLVFVLPNSANSRENFTSVQAYTTVGGAALTRPPGFLQHVTQWRCFIPKVV